MSWYAVDIRVDEQWIEALQRPGLDQALESARVLRRAGWQASVDVSRAIEAHDVPVWDDPWWVGPDGEPLPEEDPADAPTFLVMGVVHG